MKKHTTAASPEIINQALHPIPQPAPSLVSIDQFCELEPAFSPGGIRHLFFTKGHDLPGVHRFGRKILLDPTAFIAGIKAGHTTVIAGRG